MNCLENSERFFINGQWVSPSAQDQTDIINPATEAPCGCIALANVQDVNRAVEAAYAAFEAWSTTTRAERLQILGRIPSLYQRRAEEMSRAISLEMGAPITLARESQAPAGLAHIEETLDALCHYQFEDYEDDILITHEPIGVAGLITPWNWPMNQIACKVMPALAAGCTVVLKPSESAPLSAIIFTEILHEAGVPAGVYNMVQGDGPVAGEALASHPLVNVVSFTGSTQAGIAVAQAAAPTVKRVLQELGGKSANIIFPDTDFADAVERGAQECFGNSGQSCDAPTRMLVPHDLMEKAMDIAAKVADSLRVGDPADSMTELGPVVSASQFNRIQALIEKGTAQGAILAAGGAGRPEGLTQGYYVRPTVFGHVTSDMVIAQEEIFGPVLSIIGYADEDDAIRLANSTPYGLAAYVQSGNLERARRVARKLRAGTVTLNGAAWTVKAPFGGYGLSGNGRECSRFGIAEFLETKAIVGYGVDSTKQ